MALIPAAFLMIMLGIYFVKQEKTYPMIPILVSSLFTSWDYTKY